MIDPGFALLVFSAATSVSDGLQWPWTGAESSAEAKTTLLDVHRGETVRIVEISHACEGTQRQRLLDLGVVCGTEITPELVSAAGDPVAYRIRGALIALRRTQASLIVVVRVRDCKSEELT